MINFHGCYPRFSGASVPVVIPETKTTTESPAINVYDDVLDPLSTEILCQFFDGAKELFHDYEDDFRTTIQRGLVTVSKRKNSGLTFAVPDEKGTPANAITQKAFQKLITETLKRLPEEFQQRDKYQVKYFSIRYKMRPGEKSPSVRWHNDRRSYNAVYTLRSPELDKGAFMAGYRTDYVKGDVVREGLPDVTEVKPISNRLAIHKDAGTNHSVAPMLPTVGQEIDKDGYVYRDIVVLWVSPINTD